VSRSYRKPWAVDGMDGSKYKQFMKNQANRRVRRAKNVPDGKAYRKFSDPWDIVDWKFFVNVKDKDDPFYEEEFWKYTRK
jgi:hypothetical protein